jgi:hypothetical protein
MERFIINTFDSIDADFNSEDVDKLEEFLEENISSLKNLAKYDNFIVDFPTVQIQSTKITTMILFLHIMIRYILSYLI